MDLVKLMDSCKEIFIFSRIGCKELTRGSIKPAKIASIKDVTVIICIPSSSRYKLFCILYRIISPRIRDAIMAGTTNVRHLIRVTPTTTYTFVSPSILVIPFSNYSRSMLTMTRLWTTRNDIIAKPLLQP